MGAEKEEKNNQQPSSITNPNSNPNPNPNPMTPAQFADWRNRKNADASASKTEAERKRAADVAAGIVPMNGRELFVHEPWVFDNTRY